MTTTAPPRHDVPLGIAAGALFLLIALFAPLVQRTPAWPTELPHLPYDERPALDEHRAAMARPLPSAASYVARAWDDAARAAVGDDRAAAERARERFAEVLAEATSRVRAEEVALRERAAERFLAGAGDARAPLTVIARRHRLVGDDAPVSATRAARLAWFALRWERAALPTPDDGRVEPLVDTLVRIPRGYQRAFTSWALDARCGELLGVTEGRGVTADDVRRCATFRHDLLDVAAGLDGRYPRDEALAALDTLQGLGLRRAVTPGEDDPVAVVVDDAYRANALADATAALLRAQEGYVHVMAARPSRRVERHLMAIIRELDGS